MLKCFTENEKKSFFYAKIDKYSFENLKKKLYRYIFDILSKQT